MALEQQVWALRTRAFSAFVPSFALDLVVLTVVLFVAACKESSHALAALLLSESRSDAALDQETNFHECVDTDG